MMREVVRRAPQPAMLGNRYEHHTARPNGLCQLRKHKIIFVHVLGDIERAHNVELRVVGNPPSIDLQKFGVGKTTSCDLYATGEQISTDEPKPREPLTNPS